MSVINQREYDSRKLYNDPVQNRNFSEGEFYGVCLNSSREGTAEGSLVDRLKSARSELQGRLVRRPKSKHRQAIEDCLERSRSQSEI